MQQMTWRADDELLDRVRRAAAATGRSLNEYVSRVMDAVTDPDLAGGEAQVLRERLARAGLLALPGRPRTRPDAAAVAAARARGAGGTPAADLLVADRG